MGFFSKIGSAICGIISGIASLFTSKVETGVVYSQSSYQSSSLYRDSSLHNGLSCNSDQPCCDPSSLLSIQESVNFLQLQQLDEFPMPTEILATECGENAPKSISSMMSMKDAFRDSEDLYISAYKMMIFFEEAVKTIEMNKFNFKMPNLNRINGKHFYFIAMPGSDELLAAIDDNQLFRFTLKPKTDGPRLDGKIKRRESSKIYVEIFPAREWREWETYDISFQIIRTNFQLQHNALQFIKKHRLFNILINNPLYHTHRSTSLHQTLNTQLTITNLVELNTEQAQAVECMVKGANYPFPYLLYGPPGTGKTKTIVAAIENIVRTTTKNVLVCAQSNAACNEIMERLCKVLSKTQLFRMFSASYDLDQISATIRPFCNLFDGELKYPTLDYLYKFRVLVCTLSTSGCLVRARHYSEYNSNHFGYVFIDECASAHETMALIPIAGLCTSLNKVCVNIILCGDPKQLDAVTKSDWAIKLGFKTSWFEQLFNLPMYKRHATTGEFNQTFITQLVNNYRSHKKILKIPNELFYESTLNSMVSPEIIELDIQGLQSRKCPIIFKSVHGICKRPENDPSSFNMDEVNEVMKLIEKLLEQDKYQVTQTDIGIVSPYKLQCKIIRQQCDKKEYKNITIGTAEVFQGQERKVIIISTVQSGKKYIGQFLCNAQRFNVMITRAKNLLIVVGDPHLLSKDSNWSTFIKFCFKNYCVLQGKRYFRPKDDQNGPKSLK